MGSVYCLCSYELFCLPPHTSTIKMLPLRTMKYFHCVYVCSVYVCMGECMWGACNVLPRLNNGKVRLPCARPGQGHRLGQSS